MDKLFITHYYYPVRKKADEFVREKFIELGGTPKLLHPYSFTLLECEYLKEWFNSSDKILKMAGKN